MCFLSKNVLIKINQKVIDVFIWILKLAKLLLKIIIGTKKILESFISSVPNKKHLQPPG